MMDIKYRGTYTDVQETYTLSVDYIYYYEWGNYEHPGEEDLEITAVYIDDTDITDFYWDRLDCYDEVVQYARENM